jgi:hypothetical protein
MTLARRISEPEFAPWPRHLARFDADRWLDEAEWHIARAAVARSLDRPVLPEIRAATRCTAMRRNLSRRLY